MPSKSGCGDFSSSVFQPICGIFKAGFEGLISTTSPGIQSKPSVTVFSNPRVDISCMPTQMPRNGLALSSTAWRNARVHSVDRIEPGAAIGVGADTGKHHTVGLSDMIRIGTERDGCCNAGFAGRAFESLERRTQIARPVINYDNLHQVQFLSTGTRPMEPVSLPGWRPSLNGGIFGSTLAGLGALAFAKACSA
jgi:hypothetical protein